MDTKRCDYCSIIEPRHATYCRLYKGPMPDAGGNLGATAKKELVLDTKQKQKINSSYGKSKIYLLTPSQLWLTIIAMLMLGYLLGVRYPLDW